MTEGESPYSIVWTSPAKRDMARLPARVIDLVVEFIYGPLIVNPRRLGRALRWELEGRYSAHRGQFRVVYRIEETARVVYIERVGHRADVYRQ